MDKLNYELIRNKRKELHLSLQKVAVSTKEIDPEGKGISQMTIQRLEKGSTKVSARALILIGEVIGTSVKTMFSKVETEDVV